MLNKGERNMKKKMIALMPLLMLGMMNVAYTADWNLVKNVKRLESVAPDYKDDKEVDKKFLEVLALTEKTKKESEVYEEAKRIATLPALAQSKYMDSFQYYMMVKSLSASKGGVAELDYWLGLLKASDKSPHLLPAWLVHMKQQAKNSPVIRADAQKMVDWIKTQKDDMKVRAPEYSGNMLMGHKPRSDFAEGDYPKLYKLSYYKATVTPPAGFTEEEIYVALLDKIKDGREDVLTELSGIYKKMGKRKEASDLIFQLAVVKIKAKDFQGAKPLLDDAVKQNPENTAAVKERDRIKLELTYQSLAPAVPVAPTVPVTPAPVQQQQKVEDAAPVAEQAGAVK